MESRIKLATVKDVRDIQKLNLLLLKKLNRDYHQTNNCAWSLSKSGEKYFKEKIIRDDCCVFIALIDSKIVGYLVGSIQEKQPYRDVPNSAEIDSFFIVSKFRNKGIGSRLYKKFIEWCNSKNIKRINVVTPVKNLQVIEFYKKSGFVGYDLTLECLIQ